MTRKKFPFQEAQYPTSEGSKASDAYLTPPTTHNSSEGQSSSSDAYETSQSSSTKRVITSVTAVPQIERLLEDALNIISTELSNYRRKVRNGNLDLKDARAVQGYMESLTKMAKEAREARKDSMDSLKNLSEEDLIKLLQVPKTP